METSLKSDVPELMAVGVAGVDTYTEASAPEEIYGQAKYLGYQQLNKTLVS
jgi:hypothetical protein